MQHGKTLSLTYSLLQCVELSEDEPPLTYVRATGIEQGWHAAIVKHLFRAGRVYAS